MKRFLTRRQGWGLLIAPLAAPVMGAFVAVLFLIPISIGEGMGLRMAWMLESLAFFLISLVVFGGPVAYLVAIVFGLPVLKYLEKTCRVSFFWILGSAGFLGMLVPVIWIVVFHLNGAYPAPDAPPLDLKALLSHLVIFGCFSVQGVAAGWVFWLVAYKDWGPDSRLVKGIGAIKTRLRLGAWG